MRCPMKIQMTRKDGKLMTWEFPTDTYVPRLVAAIKENEPTWRLITVTISNPEA